MPSATPHVTPVTIKEVADPAEAEVNRLQKLLHEHQQKGLEISDKLQAATQAYNQTMKSRMP